MKYLKEFGNCSGPLGFPMQENDARELETMLETGEWSPCRVQKAEIDGVFPGERSDISVIADNTVDKEGDVVSPKSLDFSRFQKNPVVAYHHMYNIPPVGKSLWQKLVGGTTWKAKTQYISRPTSHPKDSEWFPDSVFHMVQAGSMKGKSIGGAVKWRQITEDDLKENPHWKSARRVSERVIVWEYSVCPIAVNHNTIVEQVSKSQINIPKEILLADFPEVAKLLENGEKQKDSFPVIKTFLTSDQFLQGRKALLESKIDEIQKSIPQMVEDTIKRFLGKVS